MSDKTYNYSYSKLRSWLFLFINVLVCSFFSYLLYKLHDNPDKTAFWVISPGFFIFFALSLWGLSLLLKHKEYSNSKVTITNKDVIFPKLPFQKGKKIQLDNIKDLLTLTVKGNSYVTIFMKKGDKYTYTEEHFENREIAREFYEILLSHVKKA